MKKFNKYVIVLTTCFLIVNSVNAVFANGNTNKKEEIQYFTSNTSMEKEIPVKVGPRAAEKQIVKLATVPVKVEAPKQQQKKIATTTQKKSTITKQASSKTKTTASSGNKRSTPTSSRGKRTTASFAKSGEVIDYAKEFIGVPYVFGGASPSGFDCSGFTMYVFNKVGIELPHSATAQYNMGIHISRGELQPGDLVFFETYKKGISHVGIYIGNGNFIEASSSRGIAITSLSSSYYAPRYRGAARIIK